MKGILILLLLTFFFLTPPLSYGQKANPPKSPNLTVSQQLETAQKAALKAKLKTFRNTVKAERVNRINVILETLNTTQTEVYKKHLSSMQEIITKLEQKISQADAAGKDTTTAKLAITNAKQAVGTAQAAVALQQQKDYVVTISSENTVKTDIMTLRNTVHADLTSTKKTVHDAKQAVTLAITATEKLFGVKGNE